MTRDDNTQYMAFPFPCILEIELLTEHSIIIFPFIIF